MNKYLKTLREDKSKRDLVIEILGKFNGESYAYCREILELTHYFLKEQAYLDFELARDTLENEE